MTRKAAKNKSIFSIGDVVVTKIEEMDRETIPRGTVITLTKKPNGGLCTGTATVNDKSRTIVVWTSNVRIKT